MRGAAGLMLACALLACSADERRPPAPELDRLLPSYGRDLRNDTLADTVHVRYHAYTDGSTIIVSLRAAGGENQSLQHAIREVLESLPPVPAGAPIRVTRDEIFVLAAARDVPRGDSLIAAWDVAPGGIPRVTLGAAGPEPRQLVVVTASELMQAAGATLDELAQRPEFPDSTPDNPTLCISIVTPAREVAPSGDIVRSLEARGRRAVSHAHCPRLYSRGGMAPIRIGPDGRPEEPPPGWVNPYQLYVATRLWSRNEVQFSVSMVGADGLYHYSCEARRASPLWTASCSPRIRQVT